MIDHCIFCNKAHELCDDMGLRFSPEDCSPRVHGLSALISRSRKHQCFCTDGWCLDHFPESLRTGCPQDPERQRLVEYQNPENYLMRGIGTFTEITQILECEDRDER